MSKAIEFIQALLKVVVPTSFWS